MTPEQEQQIIRLRTAYESGALDKGTYEAAATALLGATFQADVESGAAAQGQGATAVGKRGAFVGGNVGRDLITGNVYHGPQTADPVEALRIYRQVIVHNSGTLPLRGVDIGASDASGGQRAVGLANVYIDLDTTSRVEDGRRLKSGEGNDPFPPQDRESKPIPALQMVADRQRLVLTGAPGGGKSTFVNHLAYCLAAHHLTPGAGWLTHLSGWPDKLANLLPVIIILRDFAAVMPDKDNPPPADPAHLWTFITRQLKRQNLSFAADPLLAALEKGDALLLLDGLDEAPADKRLFVRDAVAAFARRYPLNRYLVTCRILSYQEPEAAGNPDLRMPSAEFPMAELAPFDEKKIDRFIEGWYGELTQTGAVREQDRARLARRLQAAVRRPDLRRLAPNPLLLTVMALVHTHQGRLPDSRALLYENSIDMLLWRWEEMKTGGQAAVPPLRQLLLDAGRSETDLKGLLCRLAYEAHGQIAADAETEAVADISESRLTRALYALKREDWTWVYQVVEAMKLRAGLLLEKAPGVFTFPHRTFQEYLAGAHLSNQADFSERVAELAGAGVLWREAILLAVGRLVHLVGNRDSAYALINRLCPTAAEDNETAWKNAWLAGDALLEMGLRRAQDDVWGAELLARVRLRLQQLVAEGKLTPRERMDAGDTLARIGDERPGVCTLEPEMIAISAGKFLMGEDKLHEVEITEAYAIARYPVTNAQYQMFVDDGGYTERWRHCWTEAGWQWREGNKRTGPRDWDNFTLPNQPRVGVTWYEAAAYARWLAAKTGKPYRLPTEAEWERAARHVDGRTYPWGEDWQDGMTNSKKTGLGRTTAVGIFPLDTAVCGAQDMSGNVNEWQRTRWRDEKGRDYPPQPYRADDGREDLSGGDNVWRVFRGGAFNDDHTNWLRCGARLRLDPDLDHFVGWNYGFRLALSPFFDSER